MKSHCWQFDAYGKPSKVLQWREQELSAPGAGEVLIKIISIGINSADFNYVEGRYFPSNQFPSCVGSEAVGAIVALGALVNDGSSGLTSGLKLEVGAHVALLGARVDHCTMGVCRDYGIYDQAALAPLPNNYTDEEGAAFWTGVLTMAGAMEMAGLSSDTAAGKTVLVTAGASGMGVMALKLAKLWGASTIATTRKAQKTEALRNIADQVVVCDDAASLANAVSKATNETGVDLILDPVGANYYPALLEACANGGDIVSYECFTGSDSTVSVMDMMMKGVSFHGYTIFRPFGNPVLLQQLIDLGMTNSESLRPLISKTYSLAELPAVLEELDRCEHIGKLVVNV